ncbi:hypothetical protein EVAR_50726_1 [Eumeta japonica]|uniref:Uncharacterized protein n=1 Tax=Eumeta variegata TaxID=151549 RepID=A0A4C1YSG4_EUMVA|nr:hypothetical protein EVAR_50726_1 [Eumeta japonica]
MIFASGPENQFDNNNQIKAAAGGRRLTRFGRALGSLILILCYADFSSDLRAAVQEVTGLASRRRGAAIELRPQDSNNWEKRFALVDPTGVSSFADAVRALLMPLTSEDVYTSRSGLYDFNDDY